MLICQVLPVRTFPCSNPRGRESWNPGGGYKANVQGLLPAATLDVEAPTDAGVCWSGRAYRRPPEPHMTARLYAQFPGVIASAFYAGFITSLSLLYP